MKVYIDLKKADGNIKAPKSNISSGANPAGTKRKPKYGVKVWHRGKDRYPKRPNNALGETDSTWVLPYGQNPQYTNNESSKDDTSGEGSSPTPEEHKKLSEVASQMGNTKLAEKHSLLAEGSNKKSSYTVDPKYQKKIDSMNEGDKGSFTHSIEDVDLNDIDIPEVWSKEKYSQAEKDIQSGKKLDPIRAEMGDNGKYVIEDGIHRANAAKKLGHSHIPVHITRSSKDVKSQKEDSVKEGKNLPASDQEKAQNLIHNGKATEAKKRAKEVLRAVPSEHKEALQKIIQVLEDHETKTHVPSSKEKRELKEIISAVNSIAKPIEKKRAETAKEFDKKMADKAKEDKKAKEKQSKEEKRIYIKTEKDKEKQEKVKEKELKSKEKERTKVAEKKQKEFNKLKERIDRDVKKPSSISEEAEKATHVAEAKEVLRQIEDLLKDSKDPDLTKLLEAHRSVARHQLDVPRLPTKEDIKSLKNTKRVIQQQVKDKSTDKKGTTSSERVSSSSSDVGSNTSQGQSSAVKTRDSYNTGRSTGEEIASQATEESGGQLSGKTAGAVGYGIASASHKLLTDDDDNKIRKDFQKAVDSAFGIDSETGRNTDTFDDEQPIGQGSDLPEEDIITKALLNKLDNINPRFNSEIHFMRSEGCSNIKGLKKSRYNKFLCDRMQNSIDKLIKSL